ncbi:MAG: DUF1573 domain-containing protein [Flavobacteriales bacterium]|nr:DUF1573 domain-containing protein [Flavobacteriales bacterium]
MRHTFFLLLLLVVRHAAAQDTLPDHGPRIAFDHVVHPFGVIPEGGDGQCTFTFTNTGDEPLVITSCQSSCGCVVPSWDKDPVAPGGMGRVRVRYDTKRVGPFTKSVTVRSSAVDLPVVVLTIKGEVKPRPLEAVGAEGR